jgi:hypothetical protein
LTGALPSLTSSARAARRPMRFRAFCLTL